MPAGVSEYAALAQVAIDKALALAEYSPSLAAQEWLSASVYASLANARAVQLQTRALNRHSAALEQERRG